MSQPIQTVAAAQPVPCPDGKVRVGLQLGIGPLQVNLIIEPELEQADAFAAGLAAGIKQAAAEARRANLGIVLPGQTPAPVQHFAADPVPPALRGRRNGHGG